MGEEAFSRWKDRLHDRGFLVDSSEGEAHLEEEIVEHDGREVVEVSEPEEGLVEQVVQEEVSVQPAEKSRSFENNIVQLPEHWNFLVHGTAGEDWDSGADVVEIEEQEGKLDGLYAASESDISQDLRGVKDITATQAKGDDPVELRIAFPSSEILMKRLGSDVTGLSDRQMSLMRKVYSRPAYANIPSGQRLIKLGEGEGHDGRRAIYYVPEIVKNVYDGNGLNERSFEAVMPSDGPDAVSQEDNALVAELSPQRQVQVENVATDDGKVIEGGLEVQESVKSRYIKHVFMQKVPTAVRREIAQKLAAEKIVAKSENDKRLRDELERDIFSGNFTISDSSANALQARIKHNGFDGAGPAFWDEKDPRSAVGRIVADARLIAEDIVRSAS